MAQLGKWAFIVGLVIAVAGGLGLDQPWFGWVLALLGLIVGFLNVTDKECTKFLLAAIGLIIAANAFGGLPWVGGYVTNIIAYIIAFISGALLVVALKVLFETVRD